MSERPSARQPDTTAEFTPLSPPPDPIAPLRAALRGHYEFERELGQGAFATVYLARDLKHERKVAIKILHADPNSETGELRFVREIRLLAQLQHPNILPLHDSGHVETLLYYVMPYVSGETLRDRLRGVRHFRWDTTCSLACDVADALNYAHGQGIIHRDIKPENILLSAGHPMLADFGIARVIDIAGVKQLTRTGMGSPGTPAYMSPEQLLGISEVDGRSDIYSLGCVMFEMLTGTLPFPGEDGLVNRFTNPAPRISKARSGVPLWLDDTVAKALEKNAADRFQTAAELLDALSRGAPARATAVRSGIVAEGDSEEPFSEVDSLFEKWKAKWIQLVRHHRVGLIAGAAMVIAVSGLFGFRHQLRALTAPARPDSTRVVVLPFRGDARTGEVIKRAFQDVWSDWSDLHIMSDAEVAEYLPSGRGPRSLTEARALAKKLRAGRVVWGEMYSTDKSPAARVELYNLAEDAQSPARTAILSSPLSDPDRIRQISFALLKDPARPAAADGGDGGTRSMAAWSAFGKGHIALAAWNLPGATRAFREAVDADPTFAAARTWLAQLLEWTRYQDGDWRAHANRAEDGINQLSASDALLAAAVAALARSDFPAACAKYRALTELAPTSFIGWYGLGECQLIDDVVIPNPSSKSRWSFRASRGNAFKSYVKAVQLEPRTHGFLTFDKVESLLPISTHASRIGRGPNSALFAAYPSLLDDTLAFVPYPLSEFAVLPINAISTRNAALDRDSNMLLAFASDWAKQFPQSAEAQEAMARVLEARGEVSDAGAGPSALDAVRSALAASSDESQRLRLVSQEVRLYFKRSEFSKAQALADSLLSNHSVATRDDASELIALAALTGRAQETARLARAGGWELPSTSVAIAAPVSEIAATLFARSALGVCGAPTLALARRLEDALQSYVPDNKRTEIRSVLMDRSLSMLVPCTSGQSALSISSPQDRLYRMQQAYARGNFATIRATFDTLSSMRRVSRPGDLALDYIYQEAWLKLAIGDSAGAIRQLDLALGALPTLSGAALQDVGAAGAAGRAMALRVELARARRDIAAARQWAASLAALWKSADPELQSTVARTNALAEMKTP